MNEQEYLNRNSPRPEQLDNGYRQDKKGDCGCDKPFPFSEILPRDSSYIDFAKYKEQVAFAVTDVGIHCSNILTYVNNLKDFYPEGTMKTGMTSVHASVAELEKLLGDLKDYLNDREQKARDVLDSDAAWIQVSNKR